MDSSVYGLELNNCLGVVKRFLLCPVCLDDFNNPAITPCAHTFCKFCIYEHLGKKRQASCPLCMKPFTRRSLKHSGKINEITNVCRELVAAYEEESGDTLRPSSFPDEFLHLSQELTQRPLTSRLGIPNNHEILQNQRNNGFSEVNIPEPIRLSGSAKGSKIFLGTAARTRRSQQKKDINENQLTQPMVIDSASTTHSLCAQVGSINNEDADLVELFSSTQLTQPMEDASEFTSVMGIRAHAPRFNESRKNICHIKDVVDQPESAINTRHKGIRTVPSRPPLPPRAQPVVHPLPSKKDPENNLSVNLVGSYGKRNSSVSSQDRPRKQTRRESSHSTLSSAHGVFTKTHEVLCQINVTTNQTDINKVMNETESHTESPNNNELERFPSTTSVRSWPLKRSHTQVSAGTRNMLLRKYHLIRSSTSSRKSLNVHSMTSPGWSRWRTMYRELKQRGSALSLSFSTSHKPKLPANINPKCSDKTTINYLRKVSTLNRNTLKTTNTRSGSFLNRISESMLRRSKRCRLKSEEKRILVPETQGFSTANALQPFDNCVVGETPFSPDKQSGILSKQAPKPCPFVLPLRRLVPRTHIPNPCLHSLDTPNGQLRSRHHSEIAAKRLSLPIPFGQGVDLMIGVNSGGTLRSNVDEKQAAFHSPISERDYHHVQCSACGETLFLSPNSNKLCNISTCTAHRNVLPLSTDDLSCSISSTYWQAEDPGDSALSGIHIDHLVSLNRTAAASVSLFSEVGCQTSFDALEQSILSPETPLGHTTTESASRTVPGEKVSDASDSKLTPTEQERPSNALDDPYFRNSQPTDSSPLVSSKVSANKIDPKLFLDKADSFESPDTLTATSTFQTCSADIIPTVDRERLRNECNELEAVVAALQQELEAQAAELSPKATEELLRTAGTEPCAEELEVYSRIVEQEEQIETLPNESGPSTSIISHTLLDASPEPVDVIPSSQADEEIEDAETSTGNKENMLSQSTSLDRNVGIPRVEASQPASSLSTVICDLIPASAGTAGSQLAFKAPDVRKNSQKLPKIDTVVTELTECPETDLDGLSYRVDELSTPHPIPQLQRTKIPLSTLAITGSNLSATGVTLLQRFCKLFGVTQHSRFVSRQTTHIVMREESDRPRVVKRTLKYFVGILNRAWIVNTQWLTDSIEAGLILDETPYEIEGDTVCGDRHEGPRRGRLNLPAQPYLVDSAQMGPPSDRDQRPFAGLWLCAFGGLGLLNLSDFLSLAVDGGASRVFEKPEFLSLAVETYVKSESDRAGVTRRPRAMILTNHNPPDFNAAKCQELYLAHGIPVISIDWMLNCISLYRRIPISPQYRICPTVPSRPQVPLAARNAPR